MQNTRNLFHAVVVAMVLSLPVYAGDIATGIASTPLSGSSTVTADGDIATGVAGQMDTPKAAGDIRTTVSASDSVLQAALNLLRGVMALF